MYLLLLMLGNFCRRSMEYNERVNEKHNVRKRLSCLKRRPREAPEIR